MNKLIVFIFIFVILTSSINSQEKPMQIRYNQSLSKNVINNIISKNNLNSKKSEIKKSKINDELQNATGIKIDFKENTFLLMNHIVGFMIQFSISLLPQQIVVIDYNKKKSPKMKDRAKFIQNVIQTTLIFIALLYIIKQQTKLLNIIFKFNQYLPSKFMSQSSQSKSTEFDSDISTGIEFRQKDRYKLKAQLEKEQIQQETWPVCLALNTIRSIQSNQVLGLGGGFLMILLILFQGINELLWLFRLNWDLQSNKLQRFIFGFFYVENIMGRDIERYQINVKENVDSNLIKFAQEQIDDLKQDEINNETKNKNIKIEKSNYDTNQFDEELPENNRIQSDELNSQITNNYESMKFKSTSKTKSKFKSKFIKDWLSNRESEDANRLNTFNMFHQINRQNRIDEVGSSEFSQDNFVNTMSNSMPIAITYFLQILRFGFPQFVQTTQNMAVEGIGFLLVGFFPKFDQKQYQINNFFGQFQKYEFLMEQLKYKPNKADESQFKEDSYIWLNNPYQQDIRKLSKTAGFNKVLFMDRVQKYILQKSQVQQGNHFYALSCMFIALVSLIMLVIGYESINNYQERNSTKLSDLMINYEKIDHEWEKKQGQKSKQK